MTRQVLKLGGYALVSLALLAALVVFISNFSLAGSYTLTARFDDASGLTGGAPVKVAGVRVGSVADVRIDRGEAIVTFGVRDDVALPTDAVAAVRWRNLLGQRILALDPHAGESDDLLGDGDEITRTDPSADLGTLLNSLGPVIDALDPKELNVIFDEASRALQDNTASLRSTIEDVATFTEALASRDQQIARLVGNLDTVSGTLADRDQQIRTMLDNLTALSETFAASTDVVDESITQVGALADDLNFVVQANADNLDGLIADLDSVLQMVDSRRDDVRTVLGFQDEGAETAFRPVRFAAAIRRDLTCVTFTWGQCDVKFDASGAPIVPSAAPPSTGPGLTDTTRVLDAILSPSGGERP